MRVLFVSGEMIAGDLPCRLQDEGCEVKLFIRHPGQQEVLDGFVEKTNNWKYELDWVGKDGLIIFDDVGFGIEQESLREEGYTVFGGNSTADRMETDRAFSNQVLVERGFVTVPILNFASPEDAAVYVTLHPQRWVIKQNTHQSALNYVGIREDGADVVAMLHHYTKNKIRNVTLQHRIEGIEIGVARYFNGRDWVGPIEFNVEHKALFPGNIGPKTGEMGTLMWYSDDESSRLFEATLAKLKPYLTLIDYRGDIDINVFVNNQDVFPIEITARLGCPSTHMQTTLHVSPWRELLLAIAQGRSCDLKYRKDYGVVLTLATPPFPYEGVIDLAYSSAGQPIFFDPMEPEEKKRVHFEGTKKVLGPNGNDYFVSQSIGYTAFVSGIGQTVGAARKAALMTAKKVHIPKVFYRNDIGVEFETVSLPLLQKWGWL